MQPLIHPRNFAGVGGQTEVVGGDGLDVGSVGVEVAAKVQPLFRIGDLLKDIIFVVQCLVQGDVAGQKWEGSVLRHDWIFGG